MVSTQRQCHRVRIRRLCCQGMANSRRRTLADAHRSGGGPRIPPAQSGPGPVASLGAERAPHCRIGQPDRDLERRNRRGVGAHGMPSRHDLQRVLELGRIPAGDHVQGQENPHTQPPIG
uniref:(northern house mosquito) hypothetical protein n=1 Tax=Culex pipiens TaxID=7175 RepID=A0A8D8B395_CULPI